MELVDVMRIAGRLPKLPGQNTDVTFRELRETYEALSPEGRSDLLTYAAFRIEQEKQQK